MDSGYSGLSLVLGKPPFLDSKARAGNLHFKSSLGRPILEDYLVGSAAWSREWGPAWRLRVGGAADRLEYVVSRGFPYRPPSPAASVGTISLKISSVSYGLCQARKSKRFLERHCL